ncbi:MAG: hypothetical protein DRP70_12570, partial [Spirochaetes bacterium]
MSQHATQLNAEDGTYFKKHATLKDGLAYVESQMGHKDYHKTPEGEIHARDGYGRSIFLTP